jgi:hypothetical protein
MSDKYIRQKLKLLKICFRDDERIAILNTIYDDGFKDGMDEAKE